MKSTPLHFEEVEDAIKASARYLVKATKSDGMFTYRINMDPAVRVKKRYNLLRHAGTIYAMCTYYVKHPDEEMKSAIERAGRYLRDEALSTLPGKENMLSVWCDPEVNGTAHPPQIKLGGTGLGLAALLNIEKIFPGFTPLPTLQALGRSILYMQKEEGSFYAKYIPSLGGLQDKWNSLFYPGEAALGLLMLYEKEKSDIWLISAHKALEYLARIRKESTAVPPDHWALLATEKILLLEHDSTIALSRPLLINHSLQICETMLQTQVDDLEYPRAEGAFSNDGKTTPTAVCLEGLLSALTFLPKNHEIRERIVSSVTRGIAFLIRAQIKKGKFIGAMPRAIDKIGGNSVESKKFNRRATEVRIDYLQHAMSAMMQYNTYTDTLKDTPV